MSEGQSSSAPAQSAPTQTQNTNQAAAPRIVDANKPTVKSEINRMEEKLNPKPDQKQSGETQAQYEKRMFKVKIEGKEAEVDEDELVRSYQVRKVSDKKAREGEMARKQAEEFVHLLKTDPIRLLKDPRIGHDVRKLAEDFLANQLQDEMMDPKDRELRDTKQKLKEYEDFKKKEEEERESKRSEALKKKWTDSYTKDITEALSESGLPKTAHTVKRMAYYMHQSIKIGEPLTAKEVTQLVRQDYIDEQKALLHGVDGDTLVSILGDEIPKKLREWDIARLKGGKSQAPEIKNQKEIENKKAKTMDEFERRKFIRGR